MSFMPWASRLCTASRLHALAGRTLKTSSRLLTIDSKTPIQKFGWNYLQTQKALKRPLSPSIGIYQMQLTWGLSGLSRISGSIMGGVLVVGGAGFALLPYNFTQFCELIESFHIPAPILGAFKFIIAFPIIYHIFNGIRFLGYEFGIGADLATIYKTGYATVAITAIIALFCVLNAQRRPIKEVLKK
uniref:Succinate dehydrogenase cytochrome b560 subunit, mitochondrial n=1 Tax=Parastrongyloides trichosuri TaxID=131310 RepID=A0A0N4ZPL1_PARTI